MKNLFLLLLLTLLLSSCQKKYVDPSGFTYCSFTLKDKNGHVQRSYYLRDGKLYNHSPDATEPVLNQDKYDKAAKVMNEIPSMLPKDPETTYSCHCGDFEQIMLQYEENNRTYEWHIDLDAKNPPRKVMVFAEKVYDMMMQME